MNLLQQKYTIVLFIISSSFCTVKNMEHIQENFNDETLASNENFPQQDVRSRTAFSSRQIKFEGQQSYANNNDYALGASHGIKFEDDGKNREPNNPGRIIFQDNDVQNIGSTGLNFQENETENVNNGAPSSGQLTFQDVNSIENHSMKKKKRRKRRKPRYQRPQNTGPLLGQQNFAAFSGLQNAIGPFPAPHYPLPNAPLGSHPGPSYPGYGPVGYPGQYQRPPRHKPSFASEALSKITGALTSIALYDDYQCVPRLLCEAAGGGTLGSSGVLQSVAGLQPLLTLLSAYNGISSSPLFLFGRAVFLGMTSKTNTAACRYAYPQCPTDPEQLVHYLNNYNGGFFRFFNSPQQNPQNLDQFYQQLMLQGQHGFHNPQQNYENPYPPTQNQLSPEHYQQLLSQHQYYGPYDPQSNQQGYGFQQFENLNQYPPNYGLYRPQANLFPGQNYGFLYPNSNIGYNYYQKYGKNYPYNKKYDKYVRFEDKGENSENKIQKRIQNKPNDDFIDVNTEDTRLDNEFIFPDSSSNRDDDNNINIKTLKFPDDSNTSHFNNINKKGAKAIVFPESYNQNINKNNYSGKIANEYTAYPNFKIRNGFHIKYYDYYHGNAANFNKYNSFKDDEEGIQTVYVVRGNGDPNHPEIVKIRPGEKINL